MDKKYQIFVSSTYVDLIEERQQVMRAILEMGHIPVGMEQFSAADEEQWKIIQRQIDQSDYYVVLIAHRYGSTIPGSGISYTEKEYNYAVKQGIPTLGFVIDKNAAWKPDRFESNGKKKEELEKFKTKVMKKPVQFWSSAEDLHGKVAIALMKSFTTQPRTGWVHGDSGIGSKIADNKKDSHIVNSNFFEQLNRIGASFAPEVLNEAEQALIRNIEINNSNPEYKNNKESHDQSLQVEIQEIRQIVTEIRERFKNMGTTKKIEIDNQDIFIVHGHDETAKLSLARFLERAGFDAIILHEKSSNGKTIIEKFEQNSDVGFAIILLTPDDIGSSITDKENLKFRARQNVILELGYFVGKIGRGKVCVLHKGNVELPSDINGVVYTHMDDAGAWKMDVLRELQGAGFSIDWQKALA